MTAPAPSVAPGVTVNGEPLLALNELRTYFHTDEGVAKAVDGVTLAMQAGETLGVVGESGSGKSVMSLSILRLVASPPGRIEEGSAISYRGTDLLALSEREMRKIRGNRISMIFQEPMTSLNPVFTVGYQVAEVFRVHQRMGRREAWSEAVRMLELVRIPGHVKRAHDYPHQMSGGMRQRVMIAMALACNPDLLIADEPTTALDVTVQAQILNLMDDLKATHGSSVLLITHDLGVIAETCDRVCVMYAGQIVEHAPVTMLFDHPRHPYTHGLLRSIPRIDDIRGKKSLYSIDGSVPDPTAYPMGCRFHPRCPLATDECRQANPPPFEVSPGHTARCFHWKKIGPPNEYQTDGV